MDTRVQLCCAYCVITAKSSSFQLSSTTVRADVTYQTITKRVRQASEPSPLRFTRAFRSQRVPWDQRERFENSLLDEES